MTTCCSICTSPLTHELCVLIGCGHVYHKECIAQWLASVSSHCASSASTLTQKCPLCRKAFTADASLDLKLSVEHAGTLENEKIKLQKDLKKLRRKYSASRARIQKYRHELACKARSEKTEAKGVLNSVLETSSNQKDDQSLRDLGHSKTLMADANAKDIPAASAVPSLNSIKASKHSKFLSISSGRGISCSRSNAAERSSRGSLGLSSEVTPAATSDRKKRRPSWKL